MRVDLEGVSSERGDLLPRTFVTSEHDVLPSKAGITHVHQPRRIRLITSNLKLTPAPTMATLKSVPGAGGG